MIAAVIPWRGGVPSSVIVFDAPFAKLATLDSHLGDWRNHLPCDFLQVVECDSPDSLNRFRLLCPVEFVGKFHDDPEDCFRECARFLSRKGHHYSITQVSESTMADLGFKPSDQGDYFDSIPF